MAALKTVLVLLALFDVARAVQLQDSTFAMSLRVAKDEFDRSCECLKGYASWTYLTSVSPVNESRELLQFAQEKKMSANMQMFVRAAADKIESTLKEFERRKELEAAAEERKKKDAPAPAVFTDKEISVKPLKGDGAKVATWSRYCVCRGK
jgi:hypothetical protein